MADTEGQTASGAEVRPQETQVTEQAKPEPGKPPRNDAEAAAQAAKEPETKPEEVKPEEPKPKRNRTGEYIHKLQSRVKELEESLHSLQAKGPQKTPEPTLEQSNFDQGAHARAMAEWAAQEAVGQYKFTQQQETAQRRLQEVTDGYNAKVASFTAEHPDFQEKVLAIPYQPSEAVQLAIMTHEKGPEIAYALANDDDLAFQLASIQPHLAAAAVERVASRLTAAPEVPTTPQPVAPQATVRPVSKAPPPVQTVSGKSPTETPPEKMTDAQWWSRRQKRAS